MTPTTTDRAATIRQTLKRYGFSSRKGHLGYGLSLWGKNGHMGEFNAAKDAAMKIGVMVANS